MKLFTVVGFGACALVAVGVMNWGTDLIGGTTDPEQLPQYVNNEFVDVGVAVPAEEPAQEDPWAVPYRSVPDAGGSPPPGSGYGR